jgi:hypothetical protein
MLRPVDARGNVRLGSRFYLDIQTSTTAHAEEKRESPWEAEPVSQLLSTTANKMQARIARQEQSTIEPGASDENARCTCFAPSPGTSIAVIELLTTPPGVIHDHQAEGTEANH